MFLYIYTNDPFFKMLNKINALISLIFFENRNRKIYYKVRCFYFNIYTYASLNLAYHLAKALPYIKGLAFLYPVDSHTNDQ